MADALTLSSRQGHSHPHPGQTDDEDVSQSRSVRGGGLHKIRDARAGGDHWQPAELSPPPTVGNARRIVLVGLIISAHLPIHPSKANWLASAFPLTQGTFVLISGRLGAIYGHKPTLICGGLWFGAWSLVNGFCKSYISFTVARAMTGIGGAFIMPNAVAMLAITAGPGKMRNFSIASFAAAASLGGWLGALLPAVLRPWSWVFWCLAIVSALDMLALWLMLPAETAPDRHGQIDYVGAGLGVTALVLYSFAWSQAPSVGWQTPYEIAILSTSALFFAAFILWERNCVEQPIMPLGIFKAPSFSALTCIVLLSAMSFAISLWYMLSWLQLVRGWSLLHIAIGWIPFGIGAILSTMLAAWLIPRLAAQWIVTIGVATVTVSNLLLATMPAHQSYWQQTFFAIIIGSFCPDLVFTAAQIIASNSVSRRNQGVAASLVGTLSLSGNSLGLGFAGIIDTQITKAASSERLHGYRAALLFGCALGIAAILLNVSLVRMPRDRREGWEGEAAADA